MPPTQAAYAVSVTAAAQIERFSAKITQPAVSTTESATRDVTILSALLKVGMQSETQRLFAQVTVALPPLVHGHNLAVLVNVPTSAANIDASSPYNARTLSMSGHHVVHGPVTFTIPLSGVLAANDG